MKIKSILISLITFLAVSRNAFGTGQIGDLLIIGKDTVEIFSNPLEDYFEQKKSRLFGTVEMQGNCSALWRGYVATWKIENDSLYLIRLQTNYCDEQKTEIEVKSEFGVNKVFAYWADLTIRRPKGRLLQYIHMGYASIYEEEEYYQIGKGKLLKTSNTKYLEEDKDLLFPNEYYLQDTIKKLILKRIDKAKRNEFNKDSSCFISIQFDTAREINHIGMAYYKEPKNDMEKVILECAKEALKTFPKLMKVNHPMYRAPYIEIYFGGYCLKFPEDKEYGCIDE